MKLKLLQTEDGEIFVLKEKYPRFLAKVNTILPFDVDFIFYEGSWRNTEKDEETKKIEQFLREKRNFGEI